MAMQRKSSLKTVTYIYETAISVQHSRYVPMHSHHHRFRRPTSVLASNVAPTPGAQQVLRVSKLETQKGTGPALGSWDGQCGSVLILRISTSCPHDRRKRSNPYTHLGAFCSRTCALLPVSPVKNTKRLGVGESTCLQEHTCATLACLCVWQTWTAFSASTSAANARTDGIMGRASAPGHQHWSSKRHVSARASDRVRGRARADSRSGIGR